jgi:hypothetical protein
VCVGCLLGEHRGLGEGLLVAVEHRGAAREGDEWIGAGVVEPMRGRVYERALTGGSLSPGVSEGVPVEDPEEAADDE